MMCSAGTACCHVHMPDGMVAFVAGHSHAGTNWDWGSAAQEEARWRAWLLRT